MFPCFSFFSVSPIRQRSFLAVLMHTFTQCVICFTISTEWFVKCLYCKLWLECFMQVDVCLQSLDLDKNTIKFLSTEHENVLWSFKFSEVTGCSSCFVLSLKEKSKWRYVKATCDILIMKLKCSLISLFQGTYNFSPLLLACFVLFYVCMF